MTPRQAPPCQGKLVWQEVRRKSGSENVVGLAILHWLKVALIDRLPTESGQAWGRRWAGLTLARGKRMTFGRSKNTLEQGGLVVEITC